MTQKKNDLKNLVKSLVGTTIGIVLLLVIRAILVNLSAMEQEIISSYNITITNLISLVAFLIIAVFIYRFAKSNLIPIKRLVPSVPKIDDLFFNLINIIILIIGYFALKEVLFPILSSIDLAWFYQLIFVLKYPNQCRSQQHLQAIRSGCDNPNFAIDGIHLSSAGANNRPALCNQFERSRFLSPFQDEFESVIIARLIPAPILHQIRFQHGIASVCALRHYHLLSRPIPQ